MAVTGASAIRVGVVLAALLGACLLPARAAVDPLLVESVEARIAAGDAAGALKLLEDVIRDPTTTPDERLALLAELARLRSAQGNFADAGEALEIRAELLARQRGASAPELASVYSAAAEAYGRAGNSRQAVALARDALRIDRTYHPQCGPVVVQTVARLKQYLKAAGDLTNPLLAGPDPCAVESAAPVATAPDDDDVSTRNVVVTNDFATATPDSFTRVKVFYATDRRPTGSARPDDYYGGDRGPLDYGALEVTVPRIHKPGAVESPSLIKLEWSENPERHFVITRLETMTGDAMFADLRATLAGRRSDEAFVFVHGFNVSFADAAKRTAQIAYDLNFAGAPILYSWPSRGSAFAYIRAEAVVRLGGRHLRRFLEDVVARSGAKKINLIAHSMGNRALIDALELIAANRAGAGNASPVFEQVVFAAPDEDAALFAEMAATVRPVARRLTLYGSDNDVALRVSRKLHGEEARAGQGGAVLLLSPAIDSIDMSVLGEDMLGHGYFASAASALTDILWLFWRDAPPDGRCGMDAKVEERGRYFLFDPVRCDGPVMLSALTVLKREGAAALARLDKIISGLSSKSTAAEEWRAIRRAVAAVPP